VIGLYAVPPGVLVPGGYYVFSVSAIYAKGAPPDAVNLGGLPFCQIDSTTGIVTP
jgi:hypothetical protein